MRDAQEEVEAPRIGLKGEDGKRERERDSERGRRRR
jgi:hypothetical protein